MSSRDLDEAYRHCRRVTRRHAKSFYFCAQFLPAEKRRAIYAVYAFCRHVDDLVDATPELSDESTRRLLDEWRVGLTTPSEHDTPALLAWRDAVRRYEIDVSHGEELMRGVLMDLTKSRYQTYDELELYCYRVASVVGLMTSQIFGYDDPRALDHAVELGHAMQLTNICRDVGEDAGMGRIYLPGEELERFGVTEREILDRQVTPGFVELMKFQIERARRYYREAEPGIGMLSPDTRYTVRLSSRIYGEILDRIEGNGYDSLNTRAFVPLGRKLSRLPAVWAESRAAR